jgi:hypothetical protein
MEDETGRGDLASYHLPTYAYQVPRYLARLGGCLGRVVNAYMRTLLLKSSGQWITDNGILLLKNEIHARTNKHKADKVICSERFVPEEQNRKNDEHDECNHFLDHFELKQ